MAFLLSSGARKDELLNLEWSWLDLKRGLVAFRKRHNWIPKGTERDVGLKPEMIRRLKALGRKAGDARVFMSEKGKPISPRTLERAIQRLIALCDVPHATIHDFRHTFASHLAMAGLPLPTLQKLLGHKDIQTVMIYAHLSEKHIQESVKALPF